MLETTEHGPIREIRLARPPVNALNPELVWKLIETLERAGKESDAVVLSGQPGMFSAGLDVPELLQLDQSAMSEFWDGFQGLLKTVACMPVPTVAAITGHSPAGGAVVSLFCDYRVMSDGPFKIGLNETQVGLMLPSFIHQALVRLVGAHTAERLVVSGAMMAPQAAVDKGLVDEVAADPGQTVSSAIEWCQRHLALPRTAMLTNRASMRASLVECFDVDSAEQNRKFLKVWFSEETRATLTALVASLKAK